MALLFPMAAQHQHYVPRLMLRGFLSRHGDEAEKNQVRVFDLIEQRSFSTSIDNIMGERRFNEWWLDEETIATVEPAAGNIESYVAPLIERIRQEKRLERTAEEHVGLALLMAFQFIRTKKMRLLPERISNQVRAEIEKMGFDPAKVTGLVDWDEEALKQQHARHQLEGLEKYTDLIAEKEFFLMAAPEGQSFYLSDHPVVLHNDEELPGMMGRLGLAVPYIQIYLPLSGDIMLCAYDRAVLGQLLRSRDEQMRKIEGEVLALLMKGRITRPDMKRALEETRAQDPIGALIDTIRAGEPVQIGPQQVQSYNALQAFQAHRFVVDPNGDFEVAEAICDERKKTDGS